MSNPQLDLLTRDQAREQEATQQAKSDLMKAGWALGALTGDNRHPLTELAVASLPFMFGWFDTPAQKAAKKAAAQQREQQFQQNLQRSRDATAAIWASRWAVVVSLFKRPE